MPKHLLIGFLLLFFLLWVFVGLLVFFKRIIVIFPYIYIVFTQDCFNSVIYAAVLSSSNWITGSQSIQKNLIHKQWLLSFLTAADFCGTPKKLMTLRALTHS